MKLCIWYNCISEGRTTAYFMENNFCTDKISNFIQRLLDGQIKFVWSQKLGTWFLYIVRFSANTDLKINFRHYAYPHYFNLRISRKTYRSSQKSLTFCISDTGKKNVMKLIFKKWNGMVTYLTSIILECRKKVWSKLSSIEKNSIILCFF